MSYPPFKMSTWAVDRSPMATNWFHFEVVRTLVFDAPRLNRRNRLNLHFWFWFYMWVMINTVLRRWVDDE